MKIHVQHWLSSLGILSICGLLLACLPGTALAATPTAHHLGVDTPNVRVCQAGWEYDITSNRGKIMHSFGPTYQDYNGTSHSATVTLTATVSGTTTITASASISVDASVIIESLQATLGISVSRSLTATVSNSINLTVPSHKSGYGKYGVWKQVTIGHYYYVRGNCTIGTNYGSVTIWSPRSVGWDTWTGN